MRLKSFFWPASSGILSASPTFHILSGHGHQIKLIDVGVEEGEDAQQFSPLCDSHSLGEKNQHNAPVSVGPALSRAEVADKESHFPPSVWPGSNCQGSSAQSSFIINNNNDNSH